jgi:hypothetical protein
MAGAGLFWEKSTVGWLLVAGLFWEKSTAGRWLVCPFQWIIIMSCPWHLDEDARALLLPPRVALPASAQGRAAAQLSAARDPERGSVGVVRSKERGRGSCTTVGAGWRSRSREGENRGGEIQWEGEIEEKYSLVLGIKKGGDIWWGWIADVAPLLSV